MKFQFNELLVDLLPINHRWLRHGLVPFTHQDIVWGNDDEDVWHMAPSDQKEEIITTVKPVILNAP